MPVLTNVAPLVETRPATRPKPVETIPANPNDPFHVDRKIIEEIEEIGRKYAAPGK
jgi:hypothetical protein